MHIKILTLLLMLVYSGVWGQVTFDLSYYQDSVSYTPQDGVDMGDILSGWDEFVKIRMAVRVSEHYLATGWVDLNSGWNPQNGKIGLRRMFGEHFYVEGLARVYHYWIPWKQAMVNESENDNSLRIGQVGMASGLEHQWRWVNGFASVQYCLGLPSLGEVEYYFANRTNYRAVDHYDFRVSNYYSLNIQAGVSLRFAKAKNSAWFVGYRIVSRRDGFDYSVEHSRSEWTYDNVVQEEAFDGNQKAIGWQHHFGIVIEFGASK